MERSHPGWVGEMALGVDSSVGAVIAEVAIELGSSPGGDPLVASDGETGEVPVGT